MWFLHRQPGPLTAQQRKGLPAGLVLFEMSPWTLINPKLYTSASSSNVKKHHINPFAVTNVHTSLFALNSVSPTGHKLRDHDATVLLPNTVN